MRTKRTTPALVGDSGDPLIADAADLRGMCWMKLDMCRLHGSDFMHLANNEEFGAALKLWMAAMRQVPAGSLPNNDSIVASLAGYANAPKGWSKIRDMALYGWVPCNDDRLYHPVICDMVLEVINSKHAANGGTKAVVETAEEKKRRQNRERIKRWRHAKANEQDGAEHCVSNVASSLDQGDQQVFSQPASDHGRAENTGSVTQRVTTASVTRGVTVTQNIVTRNGVEIDVREEREKSNIKTHNDVTPNGVTSKVRGNGVACNAVTDVTRYTAPSSMDAPTHADQKQPMHGNQPIVCTQRDSLTDQEWDNFLGFPDDSAQRDVFLDGASYTPEPISGMDGISDATSIGMDVPAHAGSDLEDGRLTLVLDEPIRDLPPADMASDPFLDFGEPSEAILVNADEDRHQAPQDGASEAGTARARSFSARTERQSVAASDDGTPEPASPVSRFPEFWKAYPTKAGKKPCEKKWNSKKLDKLADVILADIALRSEKHYRWRDGFVPDPLTYLNQERWNDDIMISPVKTVSKDEILRVDKEEAMKAMFGDDVDPAYYQSMSASGQRTAVNVMNWIAAKSAEH